MHVRTDDDIYRVDSVWLGPPRATFPWRVRYVGYGVGLLVMILVMFVQRRVGISLTFISVAWALVLTVVITRFIGSRIDYERPLGQVLAMFGAEVRGPRRRARGAGGELRSGHVRTRSAAVAPPPRTPGQRRPALPARKPDAAPWTSSATRTADPRRADPAPATSARAPVTAPAGPRAAVNSPAGHGAGPAPWASAATRRADAWQRTDRPAKGRGRRATA